MSRKSKYAAYRSQVRYYLTHNLKWSKELAAVVLTDREHYMRTMMESGCPAHTTASNLHKQRDND